MLIVSQNLTNYDLPVPKEAIFRINLAWVNSLEELKNLLKKNQGHEIFLDLPRGRIKPPNNKYTIDEVLPIIESHDNVKYLAISNVDSVEDISNLIKIIPKHTTIIQKIESRSGVKNIAKIVEILGREKIVMLDHDDLYSEILRNHGNQEEFIKYLENLAAFCDKYNVILLRTIGVLFADSEKRISEYVK